jgi:hypothetical protein
LAGNGNSEHLRGDRRHDLRRKSQRCRIQRRVADWLGAEWIETSCEVAVHPESLDQGHRGRHVIQHIGSCLLPDGPRTRCRFGYLETRRSELEALLYHLEEVVLALKQFVYDAEECSRFGSLDDPVIVRARECHDLADAQLVDPLVGDGGELRWIPDSADGDDAPLASHEPRDRGHRTQTARISQ